MEQIDKIRALVNKKNMIIYTLVEPARAAANQMKDAGMNRGADPVLAVIFELDGVEQELKDLFTADPKGSTMAMLDLMRGAQ